MMTHYNIMPNSFDGRTFLLESEWLTYRRRKPVRFIKLKKAKVCQICGKNGSIINPLQNAHLIGFEFGVIRSGLTPDFLDSTNNIKTAHRRKCNKAAELNIQEAMLYLKEMGIKKLPEFLPAD